MQPWKRSNNTFHGFSPVKCPTSGILMVTQRGQNAIEDFFKNREIRLNQKIMTALQ